MRPILKLTERYGYQDIFNAYIDCRRSKRNSRSAIAYETRFEYRLSELLDEINSGEYKIQPSQVFVVEYPKPREVWAASFRDRIVHHLVYNDIGPYFEARFIEDTFSCIRGRGTLAASNRLTDFHRKITNNYDFDCWALKFDIKNFFVSIDKDILWKQFESVVGSTSLTSRLLRQIIYNSPTESPIIASGSRFDLVPNHKSLWNAGVDKGLPIGNHTSQFSSNVYLDPLDKFVKHTLRAKHYVRYVDDAVILHSSRDILQKYMIQIECFLRDNLRLELHPNKCSIKKASQGIDFVGTIIKPYRIYTRRSTIESAKKIASNPCVANIPSMNSYLGIMRHSKSRGIRKRICEQFTIPALTAHDKNYLKIIEL